MTPKQLEEKLQFLYDGMEMLEKESAIKDELIAVLKDSNAIMERYIKELQQEINELRGQRKDG